MKSSEVLRNGLVPGALAGLAGGVIYGATMSELGTLGARPRNTVGECLGV